MRLSWINSVTNAYLERLAYTQDRNSNVVARENLLNGDFSETYTNNQLNRLGDWLEAVKVGILAVQAPAEGGLCVLGPVAAWKVLAPVVTGGLANPEASRTLLQRIGDSFQQNISTFIRWAEAIRNWFQAPTIVDPNKLHHIIVGRGGHGLDDVVRAAGSREAAFRAMEKGAQGSFDAGKLAPGSAPGVFQGVVNIGGVDGTVRDTVVDGIFRIGSTWPR